MGNTPPEAAPIFLRAIFITTLNRDRERAGVI